MPKAKTEVNKLVAEDIVKGAAEVVLAGSAFIVVVKVLEALISLL